jgi:DNA-binding beta-propeller fold protein YncE
MRRRSCLGALAVLLAASAGAAPASPDPPGSNSPTAAETTATARPDPAGADTLALRLLPVQTLGNAGGERAVLVEPSGIAADAFGRVYVTDASQHRLVRFDARGTSLGEAGALGSGPGDLRRPGDVTAIGSLGVAVLDRGNRRVVLYDLFGRLLGVLTDFAALEDELGRVDPVALAADRGGALYVADADRDRVLVLDFSGRYVRTLGGFGPGAGSFRGLAGLAVGRGGELVTCERAGARVQRLDAAGSPLTAWPLPVRTGRGRLAVAVDDSTRIAVADEASGRLWLFDLAGRLLGARADLASPRAVTFAPDGSLLVAEGTAGRVRRFALEPARTATPPGR